VKSHIRFFDRFVTLEELIEFIGAADLYLTPYLNPAQITSGTLAYTVGAGKAVLSTPYWYAEELLADGRGVLVPFGDSRAIAERVIDLLDNEAERHAMRKRAYLFGREMIWSRVAERYAETFAQARDCGAHHPRLAFSGLALDRHPPELPPVNLNHLRRMTDDVGLFQHAYFAVPNYSEGYTTDDNARGLIVAVLYEESRNNGVTKAHELACRYLAFLRHALNPQTGRFRNFMSFERHWLEEAGSEDSHGRALWSLGTVIGRSRDAGMRGAANQLFDAALSAVSDFSYPRGWSFALLALHEYSKRFSGDRAARSLQEALADRLLRIYRDNSAPDWRWFEDRLTYCNAVLPHALLVSGQILGRDDMMSAALQSLRWLCKCQKAGEDHFAPIGCNGFFERGGERARFNQQPVEAQTTVSACLAAQAVTGDASWDDYAQMTFEWFLGQNDSNQPLYDPKTGGCHDGLQPDRCNENQGAESTLAFLHALLEMGLAESLERATANKEPAPENPADAACVTV
jgi:hypothetical protein